MFDINKNPVHVAVMYNGEVVRNARLSVQQQHEANLIIVPDGDMFLAHKDRFSFRQGYVLPTLKWVENRVQEHLNRIKPADDYEVCGTCGFDHGYEQSEAVKEHARLDRI